VLAGIIPAILLSKIEVIQVLKNLSNLRIFNLSFLNRILIVTQFSASAMVMIVMFTMLRQSRYMANADYGFELKGMINIPISQQRTSAAISTELMSIPGVKKLSYTSAVFGYHPTGYYRVNTGESGSSIEAAYYFVDEQAVDNFDLHLVAGRNFWANSSSFQKGRVIINERFSGILGYADPQAAVGRIIRVNDTLQFTIVGVIRDFHFENLKHLITPLILQYDRERLSVVNIKTEVSEIAPVRAAIKKKFTQLNLELPAELEDMDTRLRREQSHWDEVKFDSYLAITLLAISCLGVLGTSAYLAQTKTTEIAIRKILGANVENIVYFLCRNFLIMLALSLLIGIPAGVLISGAFLHGFAYKVSVGIFPIVLAALLILFIGVSCFGSQIVRAVFASPVKRLRTD
jgi:putative ABC transport system permease protein